MSTVLTVLIIWFVISVALAIVWSAAVLAVKHRRRTAGRRESAEHEKAEPENQVGPAEPKMREKRRRFRLWSHHSR